MYVQRVEEITPNIRYCAYNLEDGSTDINDLMQLRMSAAAAGGTHDPVLTAKIDVSASSAAAVFYAHFVVQVASKSLGFT